MEILVGSGTQACSNYVGESRTTIVGEGGIVVTKVGAGTFVASPGTSLSRAVRCKLIYEQIETGPSADA